MPAVPAGSRRTTTVVLLGLLTAVLVTACAAGPNTAAQAATDPAGFWLGLWHGIIAPITFLVSLFREDVNIYEVVNNGNWYDFGFILGLTMSLGGSGGGAGGAAKRRRE